MNNRAQACGFLLLSAHGCELSWGNAGELRPTGVTLNQEERRVSDCISHLLCLSVGDPRGGCYTHPSKRGWSLHQGVARGGSRQGGHLRAFALIPPLAWINFLPHLCTCVKVYLHLSAWCHLFPRVRSLLWAHTASRASPISVLKYYLFLQSSPSPAISSRAETITAMSLELRMVPGTECSANVYGMKAELSKI